MHKFKGSQPFEKNPIAGFLGELSKCSSPYDLSSKVSALCEVLCRYNPIDRQIYLKTFRSEDDADIFEEIFSRMFELWKTSPSAPLSALFSLFDFAYDETLFRAITSPIRKDLHAGPLEGENRAFTSQKYYLSLTFLEEYFKRSFECVSTPISAWVMLPPPEESMKQDDKTKISYNLDSQLLSSKGISIYLWVSLHAVQESQTIFEVVVNNKQKLMESEKTETIVKLTIKGQNLVFEHLGSTQSFNIASIASPSSSPANSHLVKPLFLTFHTVDSTLLITLNGNSVFFQSKQSLFSQSSAPEDTTLNLLSSFQGKCYSLVAAYDGNIDKSANAVLRKGQEFGIQSKEDWERFMGVYQNCSFASIVTPVYEDNSSLLDFTKGVTFVKINNQKELCMETPGFAGMVPLYTILRYLEPSLVHQGMIKLNHCLTYYVKNQIDELYLDKVFLTLIDTISIQIDILTQKNQLKGANFELLDSFLDIFTNTRSLKCREAILLKILAKWRMTQHCSKSDQDAFFQRLSQKLAQEPFVNHRALLSTIVLRQDDHQKASHNFNFKMTNSETTSVSPIKIYKDMARELEANKVRIIFDCLVDFVLIEKTVEVEIPFLGLFKDFLEKILQPEVGAQTQSSSNQGIVNELKSSELSLPSNSASWCLTLNRIIDALDYRFIGTVIQVKELVLGIMAEVFKHCHKVILEKYGKEYIDKICKSLADELRNYIFNPAFENKLFSSNEGISIGLQNKLKSNGGTSQKSDHMHTPSKHQMTPKGAIGLELGPRNLFNVGFDASKFTTTPKTLTALAKPDKKLIHPSSVKNSDNRKVLFESALAKETGGVNKFFQPQSVRLKANELTDKDKEAPIQGKFSFPSQIAIPKEENLPEVRLGRGFIREPAPSPAQQISLPPPPSAPRGSGMKKGFPKALGLELDIDNINKIYNIGGEGGAMIPNQEEDEKVIETVNRLAGELIAWMDAQNAARKEQMDIESMKPEPFILEKPIFKRPSQKDSNRSAPMTTRANNTLAFNQHQLEITESKRMQYLPIVNTIDEVSRSKMDSEWPGTISYTKNVFVANCSTPKETSESMIYKRLANSYITLLFQGTVTLESLGSKISYSYPDMIQAKRNAESPTNRSPSISPNHIQPTSILSEELLPAFHSILCLVPRNIKFEMTRLLTNMLQSASSADLAMKVLPVLRESIKFAVCFKKSRSVSEYPPLQLPSGQMSVGTSSHGGIERVQSLYKGMQKRDMETVLEFIKCMLNTALCDSKGLLLNKTCALLICVDNEKKMASYFSADEGSLRMERDVIDSQRDLLLENIKNYQEGQLSFSTWRTAMKNVATCLLNFFHSNLMFVTIKKLEELRNIRYYARNYRDLWPLNNQVSAVVGFLEKFINQYSKQPLLNDSEIGTTDFTIIFRQKVGSLTKDQIQFMMKVIDYQRKFRLHEIQEILSHKANPSEVAESLTFSELAIQSLLSHLGETCSSILSSNEATTSHQGNNLSSLDQVKTIFSDLTLMIRLHLFFFENNAKGSQISSLFFIYFSTLWELNSQLEENTTLISRTLSGMTKEALSETVCFVRLLCSFYDPDSNKEQCELLYHIVKDIFEIKGEGHTAMRRPGTTRKAPPKFSFTSKKTNPPLLSDDNTFIMPDMSKKMYLIEREEYFIDNESFSVDPDKFGKLLKDESILEFEKSRLYCERYCLDLVQLRTEFMDQFTTSKLDIMERTESRQPAGKSEESPSAKFSKTKVNQSESQCTADFPGSIDLLGRTSFSHPCWIDWESNQSNQKYFLLIRYNKPESRKHMYVFTEEDSLSQLGNKPLTRKYFDLKRPMIKEIMTTLPKSSCLAKSDLSLLFAHESFTLESHKPLIIKEGKQLHRGEEKPGFFVLTPLKIYIVYTSIPRPEFIRSFPNDTLVEVSRLAYQGAYNSLEFRMNDGSTFLFKFDTEDCQREVSKRIVRMRKTHAPSLIYHKTLNPENILKLSGITAQWSQYQISTLEYLCKLNALSSRTFNDFNRHPILPTVLANYNSAKPTVLSSEPRVNRSLFSEESTMWDFSAPVTYLERKHPYSKLAGDVAQFVTMCDFKTSGNKVTELTPEFFVDPSFLLGNCKKDPVGLPRCATDPYSFIYTHRRVLESEEVSSWIPKWIDSIFGVDSRAIDMSHSSVSESTLQIASQEQQNDQWHVKLFDQAHPSRIPKQSSSSQYLFDKTHKISIYEPSHRNVSEDIIFISASPCNDEMACFTRNQMVIYDSKVKVRSEKSDQGLTILHEAALYPEQMDRVTKPMVCNWNRMSLIGVQKSSPWSLVVIEIGQPNYSTIDIGNCAITSLAISHDNNLLYAGFANGELICFKTSREKHHLLFKLQLGSISAHTKVQCIELNTNTSTMAVGQGGLVTFLNSITGERIAVVQVARKISNLVFSIDPLPCVAMFCPEDNTLLVYSLTGQFITEKKFKDAVSRMEISKNSEFLDVLVILTLSNTLSFLGLPALEETKKKVQLTQESTGDFQVSRGSSSLFVASRREVLICQH